MHSTVRHLLLPPYLNPLPDRVSSTILLPRHLRSIPRLLPSSRQPLCASSHLGRTLPCLRKDDVFPKKLLLPTWDDGTPSDSWVVLAVRPMTCGVSCPAGVESVILLVPPMLLRLGGSSMTASISALSALRRRGERECTYAAPSWCADAAADAAVRVLRCGACRCASGRKELERGARRDQTASGAHRGCARKEVE